jgi:hypothetical protein
MTVAAESVAHDSALPTTSPTPGDLDESLTELARRAGRLLRARILRPRSSAPTVHAARPPVSVAIRYCLGPLVAVALVTLALAWTVWQVGVAYRVSVAGPANAAARILKVSLEDVRQTVDLEREIARGAAAAADGRAARADSVGGGGGGGGGGFKIEGPLLGAVGAGAVLGVGGLAGLVVLRRYRARLEQELPESAHDLLVRPQLLVDDIGPTSSTWCRQAPRSASRRRRRRGRSGPRR